MRIYKIAEIEGGKSEGMAASDIAEKHNVPVKDVEKQIDMGMKVEMEHVKDKDLAKEIAMDHLVEFPDYYTRLAKMEEEAKKHWEK
jgi:hypothetical protein